MGLYRVAQQLHRPLPSSSFSPMLDACTRAGRHDAAAVLLLAQHKQLGEEREGWIEAVVQPPPAQPSRTSAR